MLFYGQSIPCLKTKRMLSGCKTIRLTAQNVTFDTAKGMVLLQEQ